MSKRLRIVRKPNKDAQDELIQKLTATISEGNKVIVSLNLQVETLKLDLINEEAKNGTAGVEKANHVFVDVRVMSIADGAVGISSFNRFIYSDRVDTTPSSEGVREVHPGEALTIQVK